jgi:hypothetical protein
MVTEAGQKERDLKVLTLRMGEESQETKRCRLLLKTEKGRFCFEVSKRNTAL